MARRLAEKSTWFALSAVDGGLPDSGAVSQSFLGDYDVWTAGKGKGVYYQKAGWLEPKHAQSFEHLRYQLGYSPNKPKRATRRRSNRRRGRRMSF